MLTFLLVCIGVLVAVCFLSAIWYGVTVEKDLGMVAVIAFIGLSVATIVYGIGDRISTRVCVEVVEFNTLDNPALGAKGAYCARYEWTEDFHREGEE